MERCGTEPTDVYREDSTGRLVNPAPIFDSLENRFLIIRLAAVRCGRTARPELHEEGTVYRPALEGASPSPSAARRCVHNTPWAQQHRVRTDTPLPVTPSWRPSGASAPVRLGAQCCCKCNAVRLEGASSSKWQMITRLHRARLVLHPGCDIRIPGGGGPATSWPQPKSAVTTVQYTARRLR